MSKLLKLPVVYSYKKSTTRELELSLESLKNLAEWNGKVYVIGDKPNFEGDYTHLDIKYLWGKRSRSKSNDEVCAYLTAADFLDEFIIFADDMFILRPWSLSQHNRGTLKEHATSRTHLGAYTKQLITTSNFLEARGKPTLSYELHIPMRVKSKQLIEVADMMRFGKPMLVRSLLGNWFSIESTYAMDHKKQPITEDTIVHSSQDKTFNYEKVKEFLE